MLPLSFRCFVTAMCLLFCLSEFSLHASENQDKTIQEEKKDEHAPRFRTTTTRRSEKEPDNFSKGIEKVKEEKLNECNGNNILDWFFDLQTAIHENNPAFVRLLASQNHNCANMFLSGEEKTLLMYALERPNPNLEVIQELLNLHFNLTFVPNHPDHTILSYYEEFHPNVLTQEGMGLIIKLLMNYKWRRNNQYVSLSSSSGSVVFSGSTTSHESGPTESETEENTKERKKPGKLSLSGISILKSSRSSLIGSSGSASGTSRSPHESSSSSSRSVRNTPKNNNNNSPKPNVISNIEPIQTDENLVQNETPDHSGGVTFNLESIVSTMVRTLTRSKKTKGVIPTISFPK